MITNLHTTKLGDTLGGTNMGTCGTFFSHSDLHFVLAFALGFSER
jgi:hypothetical protein